MKPRYSIAIKHSTHKQFAVFYSKKYGDYSGGVSGYDSVEQCIFFIKNHVLKSWSQHDSIVGRQSDPVTLQNTHFESVADEITLPLLLAGQQTLNAFEVVR